VSHPNVTPLSLFKIMKQPDPAPTTETDKAWEALGFAIAMASTHVTTEEGQAAFLKLNDAVIAVLAADMKDAAERTCTRAERHLLTAAEAYRSICGHYRMVCPTLETQIAYDNLIEAAETVAKEKAK
jgi:hypothetical protein